MYIEHISIGIYGLQDLEFNEYLTIANHLVHVFDAANVSIEMGHSCDSKFTGITRQQGSVSVYRDFGIEILK